MSKIQDLRDKIHRLDGKEFKMRDLGISAKNGYFNLRDLVDLKEVTSEGTGRNAIYKATDKLKLRKVEKEKIAPVLELQGWREVFPSMFNPVLIKGNVTVHKQPMV